MKQNADSNGPWTSMLFMHTTQLHSSRDPFLFCYRFSWRYILMWKQYFSAPQDFPQWDWTLLCLLPIHLHTMKCKPFWALASVHSESHKTKLVLVTHSPIEANPIWTPFWLIAIMKLDFQHSQQTSFPAPVLVRSQQIWKRGQVWSTGKEGHKANITVQLTVQRGGAALATAPGSAHLHGTAPHVCHKMGTKNEPLDS